mgnify:CR=1 FL=1
MTDREFQKFMIEKMTELSENVNSLRQDVTRIEIKHGEKLSALFDGYEAIKETLGDHTERIEAKLETHEIQIKVLDSTKANKRKAK